MPTESATFLTEYLRAIEAGTAAVFAGAGLSMAAGYVDWKRLLADVVAELKLDPDTENLVAAAQYHVNERRTRGRLNQLLIDEFTKDAEPNPNHKLLARLPIETIWTTNYDILLETALAAEHKRVDVKHRQPQLAISKPGRHVTLYKMHGDISSPDEAVLVKEDYETYDEKRKLFSYQLQGDLVAKTFMFIGFSFTDPNIDYLLGRIRGLMSQHVRTHYCFMRRVSKPASNAGKILADYQYDLRRQQLLIGDLKRYGIQTVLVEEYSEITSILEQLDRLVYRSNVFVSGSAEEYAPFDQPRLDALCRTLGRTLMERGRKLTSGLGTGVGGVVILGAMEAIYRRAAGRVDDRLTLRPFPQELAAGPTRDAMWTRYREEMIGRAGAAVFIAGNKRVGGTVVVADGCLEEFEIAKALGRTPIPIGCTGHAAAQIWNEVHTNVDTFYPGKASEARTALGVLNDPASADVQLVEAVMALLELAGGKR